MWQDPNSPDCYGKYRIDFNDDFFFHPTYHGPLDPLKSLPGYQGNLSFENLDPVDIPTYSVAGGHTLTDNLDGVADGWYTYQFSPLPNV